MENGMNTGCVHIYTELPKYIYIYIHIYIYRYIDICVYIVVDTEIRDREQQSSAKEHGMWNGDRFAGICEALALTGMP